MNTKVLKFGGTSVSDGDAVRRVAAIVAKDETPRKLVVVSAQSGVTTTLLRAIAEPAALDAAVERWCNLARELGLCADVVDSFAEELRRDLQRKLPREQKADLITSYGERVSAVIVSGYLRQVGLKAVAADGRDIIVTDDNFGNARYDTTATTGRAEEILLTLLAAGEIPVVTGFIGADTRGRTTTLGRGGSDLTATLLAACLGADVVEIWTDADGVMSADPRAVREAKLIARLSYDEAVELSNFGARVLFNKSLPPAIRAGLPVHVRNTFNPSSPGTVIAADKAPANYAVTTKSNVRVATVATPEMVGAVGFLARLFGIFESFDLSVDVVSVSEASVSVTFNNFDDEREADLLSALRGLGDADVKRNRSIVAVISRYLDEEQAIFPKIFGALAEHGVDVEMISYGNREINLTLIVDGARERETLQFIHKLFEDNFRR
ncbi:MAG: aspartate kinase [candidate division Zixibacteria bacterium]|nr:aspartate kinase [candidate division Zixibacteria bacterium]